MSMGTAIFDDLVAEYERLEAILYGLTEEQWTTESGAPGWSVSDVVLHLAQTEEGVVATLSSTSAPIPGGNWRGDGETLDEAVDRRVREERAPAAAIFDRWRIARRASVDAMRRADPDRPVSWAATPLRPRTLATTRLAEHWAHGLDVTAPFGIPFPDTDRLRHIAWLGHATLPYAFAVANEDPHDVFCELTGPDGSSWRFGSDAADSAISGAAGAFCRVGARRLSPADSGLVLSGPHAAAALAVLRNYAA
jgi:uncharacterized protein (TIGR03084 family)